jgi:glucosamine kinase
MATYFIGIDGGGTSTRAILANAAGDVIGRGKAGPSALGQGIAQAWEQLQAAIRLAFESAQRDLPEWSECAIGAGLSGVSHQPWRDEFLSRNPGFGRVLVETDSFAMLVGAHRGQPGGVVIAGTGSIGEAWLANGDRPRVGGWGFPIGDEGSGAWLGWSAIKHLHAVVDGYQPQGTLASALFERFGVASAQALDARNKIQLFCKASGQFEYAQLAKTVFDCEASDAVAAQLLSQAVDALAHIAIALDATQSLPMAFCGSIAERLSERLPQRVAQRVVTPALDAAHGALHLILKQQSSSVAAHLATHPAVHS